MGIPTVADRVAQTVVKQRLEPQLEPHFHPDSYGYRPARSAHQAVSAARERCWQYAWVLDLDIKGFFDSIDHALLMKAIRHHTKCRATLLYVERWLRAPVNLADGETLQRWVRRKYKRLKFKVSRARELVVKIRHQRPGLFAHWALAPNGGR